MSGIPAKFFAAGKEINSAAGSPARSQSSGCSYIAPHDLVEVIEVVGIINCSNCVVKWTKSEVAT